MRDKFIFYGSFYETAKKLNDEDRLALYDAIVQYSLTGIEPELEGIADIVFTAIKPTLDTQIENYKNGKKGGRPKQKTDNENKQSDEKREDTEKEKGGLSENKKGGFEKSESYKDKEKDKEKEENIEHTRGEKFLSFDEAKNKSDVQVKLNDLGVNEDFLLHLLAYRQEIREPVKRIQGLIGLLNKFVEVKVKAKVDPLKAFEIMQEYEWKTPEAILKRQKSYSKSSKLEQKQLNTLRAVENFIKGA